MEHLWVDWMVMYTSPLTHYQTTNFRLFQTEKVCRRQFQISWKWQRVIQTGRKHCGKRRNCSLRLISPFPSVFSKTCFPGASKGVVWEWVNLFPNKPLFFMSAVKLLVANSFSHLENGWHAQNWPLATGKPVWLHTAQVDIFCTCIKVPLNRAWFLHFGPAFNWYNSSLTGIRTQGFWNTVSALYHWATNSHVNHYPHDISPNTCTWLHR